MGTTEVSGAGVTGFTVSTAFCGGPVGASVSGLRFVSVVTFSHEQTVITRINAISGAVFINGWFYKGYCLTKYKKLLGTTTLVTAKVAGVTDPPHPFPFVFKND